MRSNIFTGFLFDKHWEKAMRQLKPKQFYHLFWEFYDYHMSAGRKQIPSHQDDQRLDVIVSLIQPQIRKRLYSARVFCKSDEASETSGGVARCVSQGATRTTTQSVSQGDAPIGKEWKGEE